MNHKKESIAGLFDISHKIYTHLFKKHRLWGIRKKELFDHTSFPFGKHLGDFLYENVFEPISKLERHDCHQVLTGYETKVEDEIALQYLCYGNGKCSPYLLDAIIAGTIILPYYLKHHLDSCAICKNTYPFHAFDHHKLLTVP